MFKLLGPSLKDLFNYYNRQFLLKTVLMITDQLIYKLQYIYLKNMIHRDIKPENFLIEIDTKGNYVYITDLNFATEYRPYRAYTSALPSNPYLLDTVRFASINRYLEIGK